MQIQRVKKTADKAKTEASTQEKASVTKPPDINSVVKKAEAALRKRTVRLIFREDCGCGFEDVPILREVDSDSPLKDGDVVKKRLQGDKNANR